MRNSAVSQIPRLHPQSEHSTWLILALPTAYLSIGQSNASSRASGASGERLWERARRPGGAIGNTIKLGSACRAAGIKFVWFRYEIFRDHYPGTRMDRAQYSYWSAGKNWTAVERQRDSELIDEIRALKRADDAEIHYNTLGNVFLGTMLPNYLAMWGIRTLILSGTTSIGASSRRHAARGIWATCQSSSAMLAAAGAKRMRRRRSSASTVSSRLSYPLRMRFSSSKLR